MRRPSLICNDDEGHDEIMNHDKMRLLNTNENDTDNDADDGNGNIDKDDGVRRTTRRE